MIGVRDSSGHEVFYPPVENVHGEGILRKSTAPAPNATAEAGAGSKGGDAARTEAAGT